MTIHRLRSVTAALLAALIAATTLAALPVRAVAIPGDGPWKGKDWALLETTGSNLTSVVRWNRCGAPILYQVVLGTAPTDRRARLERLARAEIAEISRRTGLAFSYQGLTTSTPDPEVQEGTPGTDLVIAFVTGAQANGVVHGRSVAAVRNSIWSNWYQDVNVLSTLTDARVYVDWKDTKNYSTKQGKDGLTIPNVLRRSLANALGVQYVIDTKQAMTALLSARTPGSWGAGDLHALDLAGQSAWCDDPAYPPAPA